MLIKTMILCHFHGDLSPSITQMSWDEGIGLLGGLVGVSWDETWHHLQECTQVRLKQTNPWSNSVWRPSPFSDVEDPGCTEDQCVQLLCEASVADVKQWPVPVVIIMVTELVTACLDLLPNTVVECKAHVVFGWYPLCHLHLQHTHTHTHTHYS